MSNNLLLRILNDNELIGPNFNNWLRNLRIILNSEKVAYVLEAPLPLSLPPDATPQEKEVFNKWQEDDLRARTYMLASMNAKLQVEHEKMESANEIMIHLQYGENSEVKQYELCLKLFTMRLRDGLASDDHVMKMSNIIGQLHTLEIVMPHSLEVNLILQSLPPSFKPFITTYNLNRIERTLAKLSNEIQQFYKQGRKEKGQEDVFAASSSKTNKKQ
ncbi:uncharacterized protein LOC116111419 [Pistacia vera]|uniref:uncharacterized protein LOC116111419 n=1 Tax=Pistacia vera TaxID=55513 RepID=UPI001263691A|nr:uncharacterized protein LOC116111419 [Pistacia vera]